MLVLTPPGPAGRDKIVCPARLFFSNTPEEAIFLSLRSGVSHQRLNNRRGFWISDSRLQIADLKANKGSIFDLKSTICNQKGCHERLCARSEVSVVRQELCGGGSQFLHRGL